MLCIVRTAKKEGENNALKNKRMKMARIEHDLSQQDLAKLVGVTRQTIGMIEMGKYNPTLNLCVAICKTLNQTLNDLFWEVDDEKESL